MNFNIFFGANLSPLAECKRLLQRGSGDWRFEDRYDDIFTHSSIELCRANDVPGTGV
jgi:hypothetical protein